MDINCADFQTNLVPKPYRVTVTEFDCERVGYEAISKPHSNVPGLLFPNLLIPFFEKSFLIFFFNSFFHQVIVCLTTVVATNPSSVHQAAYLSPFVRSVTVL